MVEKPPESEKLGALSPPPLLLPLSVPDRSIGLEEADEFTAADEGVQAARAEETGDEDGAAAGVAAVELPAAACAAACDALRPDL